MGNKKEIEERILGTSKMLLEELTTPEIMIESGRKWGVSESQTRRYIKRCYNLWHKDFEKKRKRNLDYHLAKRADLYKQAYIKKQWNICLEIIKDEAKIMDLYPTEKHKVEIEGELKIIDAKRKLISKIDLLASKRGEGQDTK